MKRAGPLPDCLHLFDIDNRICISAVATCGRFSIRTFWRDPVPVRPTHGTFIKWGAISMSTFNAQSRSRALAQTARVGRHLTTAVLAAILGTGLAAVVPPIAQAAVPPPVDGPAAGPIDPNTGYPFWYSDGTGEKFELCLDRPNTTPGMCLAAPQNPAARPWADQDPAKSNLGPDGEAFWYNADAKIVAGGVRARFVAAQEATFGGPTASATAGEQIAFGRVRVRLDGVKPNASYTVTQPYGTATYVADDGGRVFVTQDLGCFDLPCDFTKASKSSLTSYLRWAPTGGAAPAGYVGDPGVTHEIAPGPAGKSFTVTGPGLGAGGITTDQFTVQGKLWNPTQPMLGLVSTRNSVDFGKVMLGSTAALPAQTVTLTNAGGGQTPLQLQTLALGGADSTQFTLSNDTCSNTSLAPGATCTVNVSYAPAAAIGSVHAQLNIPSVNGKDSQGGQRILLQGRVSDGSGKDARVTGPIDPASGFPKWYQDEKGTRVALCDNQNDPMCVLPTAPEGTYNPALPMRFPTNYPGELFWWNAVARFDTTNLDTDAAVKARLVLADEATFMNGDAAAGDQIAFGRIRIRVNGLKLGQSYDVVTPYGDYHFVAEDDGKGGGEINYTEDIGCLETPCNFDRVNQSNVGPFLRQVGAPNGYLGDPAVEAEVTGSPLGPDHNTFTITGPGLTDPNTNGTPLFAVSGKQLAGPTGGKLTLSATTATVTPGQPAAITLTNTGTAPANPQVSLPAGSGFAVVTNGCVDALAPGAFCTVTVGLDGADPAAPGATATLTVLNGTTQAGTVTVSQPGGVNPAPASPALTAASDTGISAVDGVTNLGRVTVSGAAASGTSVQVLVDGTPRTTVTAEAGTFAAQLNLSEGSHQLAAAYDGQPSSAATTVLVDLTAPKVTNPRIDVRYISRAVTGTVTWSGRGAATYAAQVSRNGGAFTALSLPRADVPRVVYTMRRGNRYRFRVRAVDVAGNTSPWAANAVRV